MTTMIALPNTAPSRGAGRGDDEDDDDDDEEEEECEYIRTYVLSMTMTMIMTGRQSFLFPRRIQELFFLTRTSWRGTPKLYSATVDNSIRVAYSLSINN